MDLSCIVWVTGSPSDGGVPRSVRAPFLPETGGLLPLHLPSKPKMGLRLRDTFGYRGARSDSPWARGTGPCPTGLRASPSSAQH